MTENTPRIRLTPMDEVSPSQLAAWDKLWRILLTPLPEPPPEANSEQERLTETKQDDTH